MSLQPPFEFEHEQRGSVVYQDLMAWDGTTTEGIEAVEAEWMSIAEQAGVTGSVTVFGEEMDLGRETQDHLAQEWSDNATRVGIDRIALVSDGIKARAVSANLDVPQEVRTFGDVEAALDWAGQ